VARASDSRCATTSLLACARRSRRAGGTGPLRAASEKWLTAAASARCSSDACWSIATGSRARQRIAERRQARLDRGEAGFELGRIGGCGQARGAGQQAFTFDQQLLGVGDQLVGDRLGVDLEVAAGDRLAHAGDLLGIEFTGSATREQRRGGARQGDGRARIGGAAAGAAAACAWPAFAGSAAAGVPAATGLSAGDRSSFVCSIGAGRGRSRLDGRSIGVARADF
jgi:hypothetical protein